MLCTSVGRQQAVRCCPQNSYSVHGRTISTVQRRTRTVHLPSRPRQLSKVLSAQDASSDSASSTSSCSSYPFFNRTLELQYLQDHCKARPDAISVILGPRSAGKTALLTEFMRRRGLLDCRCLIDARMTSINTPSELATALLESAIPKLAQQTFPNVNGLELAKAVAGILGGFVDKQKFADGSELTISGGALAPILKAIAGDMPLAPETPPLAVIIKAYVALLDAWDNAAAAEKLKHGDDRSAVLVLDEANALMAWGDQYKAERQTLLRFFVAITKARRRSHVILATSEYSFQSWLSKEIGPGFYQSFVVGDFPTREARGFLDQCLQQVGRPGVTGVDWQAVHKVCGGNAGALMRAAGSYNVLGDWKAALSEVVKDVWGSMEDGYAPASDAGYTAADYATAVAAVLDSPYNAVDKQQLTSELDKQPLEAMVQANLLALRPYSPWASDIPVAAFGPEQRFTVVTAPTPLHLYLMEEERSTLLAPLNLEGPPTGDSDHTATSSRPPSPTSVAVRAVADEIAAVQKVIEGVEGQIQQLSDEIRVVRKAKCEGWMSELDCLQQDKQQLVEKERQLSEKERLLREEKLLLLKRVE